MSKQSQGEQQRQGRRHFLKSSALIGSGLFLTGGGLLPQGAWAAPVAALYGSGGLTAIAIADDAARLAQHTSGAAFGQVLRHSVNEELPGNVLLLGGTMRMENEDALRLLRRLRQDGALQDQEGAPGETNASGEEDEEDLSGHKIALVLGWMAHQAARQGLAPLQEGADTSRPGMYPTEASIYHDAAVLRHRSGRKAEAKARQPAETDQQVEADPQAEANPQAEAGQQAEADQQTGSGGQDRANQQQVEAVTQLFRELGPRMLIRFHTLIPDYDDGAGWIGRLAEWRNSKAALLRRLAEAYEAPDPDKLQRYVTEPNFYDEGDALLQVARALRAGEDPPMSVAEAAAEAARNESRYAQALRQAYGHLKAAEGYFEGAADEQALLDRLRS